MDTQYNELLEACAKVNTETMTEQATIIVKDTSNQSSCNAFYRKQTSQTNPVQPSHPPIATMCYPNIFKFSTAATEHGCKHEKKVVAAYELTMKERHLNFESRSVDCF